MLKNQRESLNQLTEEDKHKFEMQMLSRRIVYNLSKYIVQSQKIALSCGNGVHLNLTSAPNNTETLLRKYTTKPTPLKQNLLSYPALPLEETLQRFLKSAEPFLSPKELEETGKELEVFLRCDGQKLQKLLEAAAAKEDNWLAERWLRTAYLQSRDPLIVFSSPGMTINPRCFKDDEEYLLYSANAIACLLKYKEIIETGKVPVVKRGKNELDNSQYSKVLGTCRIPQPKEDKMEYNPNSTHIVIIYKNHFYKLPVYSKAFKLIHRDVILQEIKKIYEAEKDVGTPFGILTSDNRDNWATAYKELLAVEGNKQSVEEIQQSLFTFSLDGEVCVEPNSNRLDVLAELLMHGCGSKMYGGNRWYDKTIQLIISRSGFQGFCYEHSPAEGQTIAHMTDFISDHLEDPKILEDTDTTNFEPAKKLPLNSSPALDKHIQTAKTNLDKIADDLHMNVLHFKGYGKGFLKQQKLSPDSFIQMALQYAFYKLHRTPGAGYETAHLRMFRNGRTETIRSCSNESLAFAKAMHEPNPDELRVDLLRKAVNAHREYTNLALDGRGVDRHILGLKLMALENKLPIPRFFDLPAVKRSSHFRISTSQVASVNMSFMCYGPLHSDGYACCYNPRENDMILSLAACRSNDETCVNRFAVSLKESLEEMKGILCRAGEKPKAKL